MPIHPSSTFSRRRLLAAGLATGVLLPSTGRATLAAQATPATGRTVETIHGPVEVPANPQRIIAINFPSAVALLELGVTPVGVTTYLPALPPGHATADGITRIDNDMGELDLELIASLDPDLIVGSDWADPANQQAPYDQLSQIAPTAIFEWQQAAGNWEAEAAGVADAIGKTAELDALRDEYTARAAGISTTYADFLSANTWDLISASDSNWYLYGPSSSHGKVAAAAGIQFGAAADQTDGYAEESYEQLGLLADTDVLLVRSAGDNGLQELNALTTYTSLPAVTNEQVLTTDYFFPSSYGLSLALLGDIEAGLQRLTAA